MSVYKGGPLDQLAQLSPSGLTVADAQQTECGSCSDHVAGCLSTPCLEMKACKIPGELLVFRLQGKPEKERSGVCVGDRMGELASKSEGRQANNAVSIFSCLGLKGGTPYIGVGLSFELAPPRKPPRECPCLLFS